MLTLSKNAKKIQEFLALSNLPLKVIELPNSTHTAQDAANVIGCEIAHIVKSLIFYNKRTGEPLLILVSGKNRVNEVKISSIVGDPIAKANAEYAREVTGFVIGGIPPLAHKQKIKTFIDQDLLHYNEIWAAAGTPNAVFCLPASKLIELTDGQIITL